MGHPAARAADGNSALSFGTRHPAHSIGGAERGGGPGGRRGCGCVGQSFKGAIGPTLRISGDNTDRRHYAPANPGALTDPSLTAKQNTFRLEGGIEILNNS